MRTSFRLVSLLAAIPLSACTTAPPDESEARAEATGIDVATTAATASDPCSALAAELAALLAAAQSCNVAAANPFQCATWVPSVSGCAQPVAAPGSDATKKYLEVFELYAQSCPLPDPPCVDPSTLTVDCTQSADTDSLVGRCAILNQP